MAHFGGRWGGKIVSPGGGGGGRGLLENVESEDDRSRAGTNGAYTPARDGREKGMKVRLELWDTDHSPRGSRGNKWGWGVGRNDWRFTGRS